VKESELRILFESVANFLESERMADVIIIEECDDGTPCRPNAIAGHRTPPFFPRNNPLSPAFPDFLLEVVIVKVCHDDELKWRSDFILRGGERFAEELATMPSRNDDRDSFTYAS